MHHKVAIQIIDVKMLTLEQEEIFLSIVGKLSDEEILTHQDEFSIPKLPSDITMTDRLVLIQALTDYILQVGYELRYG